MCQLLKGNFEKGWSFSSAMDQTSVWVVVANCHLLETKGIVFVRNCMPCLLISIHSGSSQVHSGNTQNDVDNASKPCPPGDNMVGAQFWRSAHEGSTVDSLTLLRAAQRSVVFTVEQCNLCLIEFAKQRKELHADLCTIHTIPVPDNANSVSHTWMQTGTQT